MKRITLFTTAMIIFSACTHSEKKNNALQENDSAIVLIDSTKLDSDETEFSNNSVSDFKFPTAKIAAKSGNMYMALTYLFDYFVDSLKWEPYTNDFFEYGNSDEESSWKQRAIFVSTKKLTFDDGIQLLYKIYLTDKQLDIKYNTLSNTDTKIWYAVFTEKMRGGKGNKTTTFCRVIEKDNYIQLIVDCDYDWRDYEEITRLLNKIIKERDYNDFFWKQEVSLEEQYIDNL